MLISRRTITVAISGLALLATACGGSDGRTGSDATDPPTPTDAAVVTGSTDAPAAPPSEVALTQGTEGIGSESCPTDGEPFETVKLYIEHNATDEDTGVHGELGGEAWKVMCVYYPDGAEMLVADPIGNFDTLAVADLLFESREPENGDVPIDDIRAWFPEGMYRVATLSHEGVPMVADAWFTHAIPVEPEITEPRLAEDAETAGESVVAIDDLVVTWEPVTQTLFGDPVVVTGYEVIVTDEEHEDPFGNSKPVYDVHVGPEATSLSVPVDFLRPATVYELEVLVLEESGNQTISVGFFTTE